MAGKKRKYLISDMAKAHLLTKDQMWVETIYADSALAQDNLMEFSSKSDAEKLVRKLKTSGSHTQVVAVNSIRLGFPPVEEDYENALSALCQSAGTCLRVIATIVEHDPNGILPLVADYYEDLIRSEKVVEVWIKYIEENDIGAVN